MPGPTVLAFDAGEHVDGGSRPTLFSDYAYDRGSPIGTLARALDAAPTRGWTVVSMKNDWKQIFHVGPK